MTLEKKPQILTEVILVEWVKAKISQDEDCECVLAKQAFLEKL